MISTNSSSKDYQIIGFEVIEKELIIVKCLKSKVQSMKVDVFVELMNEKGTNEFIQRSKLNFEKSTSYKKELESLFMTIKNKIKEIEIEK